MNKELFLRVFKFTPVQIDRMQRLVEWHDLIQRLVEIVENQNEIIDSMREDHPISFSYTEEKSLGKDLEAMKDYFRYCDDRRARERAEYLRKNPYTLEAED